MSPPSSQPRPQSHEAVWKTFQLAKYSQATNDSLRDSHVQWIHFPEREHLLLVLDFSPITISSSQPGDRKVLKIMRGTEFMVCMAEGALFRVL